MFASFDVTRLSKLLSLSASSANCLLNSSIRSLVCSSAFSNASSTASISFCKRVMAFWRLSISAWSASFVDSSNISMLACKSLDCFSKSLTWRFKLSTFPFKPAMFASFDVTRLSKSSNLAVSPLSLSDKLFNWFSNASLLAVAFLSISSLTVSSWVFTSSIASLRSVISFLIESSNLDDLSSKAPTRSVNSFASRSTFSIFCLIEVMFSSFLETRSVKSSSLEASSPNCDSSLANSFSRASMSPLLSTICSFILLSSV